MQIKIRFINISLHLTYAISILLHATIHRGFQIHSVVFETFSQFSRLGPPRLSLCLLVKEHPNLEILQVSNLIHFLNPRLLHHHTVVLCGCMSAKQASSPLLLLAWLLLCTVRERPVVVVTWVLCSTNAQQWVAS